ncbi:MAG TPA: hypothetical protein VEX86_07525 [Longimicrobium sp.]|nr:hypothetical protein [Longimicrobium sp.]
MPVPTRFPRPSFPPPTLRLARAAVAAAALAAVGTSRLAGTQQPQRAPEPRPGATSRGPGDVDALPGPFWLSLLAAVLSGVAGAAAAGRIAGPRGQAVPAGALETLVVGSASAVALLGVNPPGGDWPALAATSAAGGVAGQALLLASAHARRAVAAETARDAADDAARRVVVLAGEQMETLRRLAADAGGMVGSGTAPGDGWKRALDVYAERARVELMHVARRGPAPARRVDGGAAGTRGREADP